MPDKMPSIQQAMSELEKYERARDEAVECYRGAIRDFAHYTLELDEAARACRGYLSALGNNIEEVSAEKLAQSRSTLRSLLRSYRDGAAKFWADLRDQLATTERALQEIMAALAAGDGDHDERLRVSLRTLRELADSPAAGRAAGMLRAVADEMDHSLEGLRQQHRLTVSQLTMEIAVLHKRIDAMDAARRIDEATRFHSRSQIEEHIRSQAAGRGRLLAVNVRGLRLAQERFGGEVALQLLGGFAKRLKNILPGEAIVGRWSEEAFLALVPLPESDTAKLGKMLTEQLCGEYSCLQEGKVVRPTLQISLCVVDTDAPRTPDEALRRAAAFLGA